MTYYTLGPVNDGPPPPYEGMRRYWSVRGAAFVASYDQGVIDGKADVANANTVQFDLIQGTPSQDRDDVWDAHLDGYRDATRKTLGTNELSNGF